MYIVHCKLIIVATFQKTDAGDGTDLTRLQCFFAVHATV